MSVINKVLRDLDQRGAALPEDRVSGHAARPQAGIQSVASVPRSQARSRSRIPMVLASSLGLAALVAYVVWSSRGSPDTASAVSMVPPPVAASGGKPALPAERAAQVNPVPATPASESAPVADVSRPQPAAPLSFFRAESSLNLKGWAGANKDASVLPAPAPQAAKGPAPVASAASVPEPVPVAKRQQMAARETLVQAQTMWNGGARDAAVDLLQEAIAAAERNLAASPGGASRQVLASLVREWARMLLADSRPAPVWDLLSRLETPLREDADLWAVRGNAAQRLGRHQDSVHAYLAALQIRPQEQRWMLGAAVSLAALGQTASAADMAERAAAVGPISREVQTYLRQTGVPLKDK